MAPFLCDTSNSRSYDLGKLIHDSEDFSIRIGRAKNCEIRPEDNESNYPAVSRHHATISRIRGDLTIQDVGSRHNTVILSMGNKTTLKKDDFTFFEPGQRLSFAGWDLDYKDSLPIKYLFHKYTFHLFS